MRLVKKIVPLTLTALVAAILAVPALAQSQGVDLPFNSEVVAGTNFENLLTYSPLQHDIISHVLTLGYAAQAAGLVYFLATLSNIAPRYRLSSVLSAVVMASAFLELYQLFQNWNNSFVLADGVWQLGDSNFSNGFRYMNWSIDVPMLLLQLVVVLGLTRAQAVSYGVKFVIGGLLMIWTGYIGQFFEVTDAVQFWVWGAISTVFYVYVLFVVGRMINRHADNLSTEVDNLPKAMRNVFWFVLITWTIYPFAYLIPAVWPTAWGAVTRQTLYTVADITSKVIYGAILSYIARKNSEALAHEPAVLSARR